jgi:hypothetical protein
VGSPDVERTEDYVSRTQSLSGLQRQRGDCFGRRAKLVRAIGADRIGRELEHPAQERRVVHSAGFDAQSGVPKHPDQPLGEQEVLDRDPVLSAPESPGSKRLESGPWWRPSRCAYSRGNAEAISDLPDRTTKRLRSC